MDNDQQHTVEPWRVSGSGTMRFIDAPAGNGVMQEVATCMRVEYGELDANARRIVACVNACEGLPTKALEQMVANGNRLAAADFIVDAMDRQIEQAEQQRDQLLEAAEAAYELLKVIHDETGKVGLQLRAAIAAARSE